MKPLILDFKITRKQEDTEIKYQYDPASSMNMVEIDGEKKPVIGLDSVDIEGMTKTRMHRENDDDRFLHDLDTVTKVAREQADRGIQLMELTTKTFVQRERDDERITYYQ